MKTYEEMARCVIERRDQYEIEKKMKTRRLTRIAATAACAALICLAAISLAGEPGGSNDITDPQIDSQISDFNHNYTELSKEKKNLEMLSAMMPCTTVVINECDLMAMADMDVQVQEVKTYPTYLWIPEDWNFDGAYTISSPVRDQSQRTDTVKHDEVLYVPHDELYHFTTASGNKVTIAMCDFEKPLRDCIIMCDKPKLSHIYGVEATILHINDLYNAQFVVNDLYFDIELESEASPETGWGELIHLLEQIVFHEGYYKNIPASTYTPTKPMYTEDIPAVFNDTYHEAVEPSDLSFDLSKIYGGAYYNDSGEYVVILTVDTPENRAAAAAELGVALEDITFETGTYTLTYLTELQETISMAMQRRELPFVISSAVYESKNRIGICIDVTNIDQNRLDEEYLPKVYALDPLGGAIEVELVSGTPLRELVEHLE
ncbi:MAG: hypothetical protein IKY08_04080 [Firmicutes bacterium]|nr:hypothetical protein [Bacillota bacterium]